MSTSGGPNIVNNGLILNLDAANTKSFRGEATTNLVNPSWSSWGIDSSGFVTSGIRTILSQYHCRIIDSNSNTRQSIYINGISQNTTYTFSVKFKRITTGPPTLRFQIQYYNSGANIGFVFPTSIELGLITSIDWQTASYTITTPSNTNRILWYMQDGNDYVGYTHEFELKEVQLEAKSYATSFTETSRGTTVATGGGWADRTSNANHGVLVNGPSYNSANGGSIIFDGTNDSMSLPTISSSTDGFSVSLWINSSRWALPSCPCANTSGILDWSTGYFNYTAIAASPSGPYFVIYNTSSAPYGRSVTFNANNINVWYNIVATFGPSVNGVLKSYTNSILIDQVNLTTQNGEFTITSTPSLFAFNRHCGNCYFEGKVAQVAFYNKVLTSSEITQNYNATKSRFGLP